MTDVTHFLRLGIPADWSQMRHRAAKRAAIAVT
jgi:hypothetical protein